MKNEEIKDTDLNSSGITAIRSVNYINNSKEKGRCKV